MSRSHLATLAVLALMLGFALFGREYGLFHWLELRRDTRREQAEIERLTVEVDSMKRYLERIGTDRRLLERLARENLGMLRPGEVLYRFGSDSLDGQ